MSTATDENFDPEEERFVEAARTIYRTVLAKVDGAPVCRMTALLVEHVLPKTNVITEALLAAIVDRTIEASFRQARWRRRHDTVEPN